jgi:hypothetical protein
MTIKRSQSSRAACRKADGTRRGMHAAARNSRLKKFAAPQFLEDVLAGNRVRRTGQSANVKTSILSRERGKKKSLCGLSSPAYNAISPESSH